jgi:flagellar biosynthesis chaperone FliJ
VLPRLKKTEHRDPKKEIQKCARIYLSVISELRKLVKDKQQIGKKIYNSVSKGNLKSIRVI